VPNRFRLDQGRRGSILERISDQMVISMVWPRPRLVGGVLSPGDGVEGKGVAEGAVGAGVGSLPVAVAVGAENQVTVSQRRQRRVGCGVGRRTIQVNHFMWHLLPVGAHCSEMAVVVLMAKMPVVAGLARALMNSIR
jgi:hypothetical protein